MKKILVFTLALMLEISCTKKAEIEKQNLLEQENFVGMDRVVDIASTIEFPNIQSGTSIKSSYSKTKEVKSIDEVRNDNGVTAFYIINYIEGGFLVVSADLRTVPILAFSDKNSFPITVDSIPDGVKFWIKDSKNQIFKLQNSNIKQTSMEILAWKMVKQILVNEVGSLKNLPNECYIHDEITTVGPYCNTKWHQNSPFNNALDLNDCGYKMHVGCGPLSLAQILNYYEYPAEYNWSIIPENIVNTSLLIRNVHQAINNIDNTQPWVDCNGTYTNTSVIPMTLKSEFNFASAEYGNYNPNVVKQNLNLHRPVLLRAEGETVRGHIWVCDGYKTTTLYWEDCSRKEYLHFNMLWGYYGGLYDGWYLYNNFNPGLDPMNNNKLMVYNIIP